MVVLVLGFRHDDGWLEENAAVLVFRDDEALVAATGNNDPAAMVGFDEVTHREYVIPHSHNGQHETLSSESFLARR